MMPNSLAATPLTKNAICYAWQQLATRAGLGCEVSVDALFERVGLTIHYARPEEIPNIKRGIIVVPCKDSAWHHLCQKEENSLSWIAAEELLPGQAEPSFNDQIPVLFWGAGYEQGDKPFVEKGNGETLIFYADIIASTFFMLSRWEEFIATAVDSHDRFPAHESVACRQRFIEYPLIDLYGLVLRAWLQEMLPDWQPEPRSFAVQLSHDIDFVRRFQDGKQIAKTLAFDLVRRRNLSDAWATIHDAYRCIVDIERNSYFLGIQTLADLSSRFGLKSVFNFMATENDPYKTGYDPNQPLIATCIHRLIEAGHEIGFHAGYYTYNDDVRFQLEKSRLDAVAPGSISGGRQHFLRFRVPETWRYWANANLAYDSTLGYAAQEGFRCGTCHPFEVFDLEADQALTLREVPLIVMDSTLRVYRKLTPQQGKEQIVKLAKRCAQVGGTFTLLWHNSSLSGEWAAWAVAYEDALQELADLQNSEKSWRTL